MPIPNRSLLQNKTRIEFTEDYQKQIFILWYNLGKPTSSRLYSVIVEKDLKEELSGEMVSENTLRKWIKDFEAKAIILDKGVSDELEKQLVADKINTMKFHAEMGRKLQVMGMDYLENNGLGNARNALSAVLEGMRVEKENSGTAIKLAELDKLSNEELVDELRKLVENSEIVDIEPND